MAFKFKVAYADDPAKVQPAIDAGIIDEGDLVIINDNGKGSMLFITNTKEAIGMTAEVTDADKEDIINEVLVQTDERYASMDDIVILDGNYDNGVAAEVTSMDDLIQAIADESVTSITLADDIIVDKAFDISQRSLTIDLNNHNIENIEPIWDEDSLTYSIFSVENAALTFQGEGLVKSAENDGYIATIKDNGTVYVDGGNYNGNITDFYLKGENAKCYITNGKFEIQQHNENGVEGPYSLLINIKNKYRDSAKCVITGGTFVGFNPAEPEEGNVKYLPEGYTTSFNSTDNSYTVIKEG